MILTEILHLNRSSIEEKVDSLAEPRSSYISRQRFDRPLIGLVETSQNQLEFQFDPNFSRSPSDAINVAIYG